MYEYLFMFKDSRLTFFQQMKQPEDLIQIISKIIRFNIVENNDTV